MKPDILKFAKKEFPEKIISHRAKFYFPSIFVCLFVVGFVFFFFVCDLFLLVSSALIVILKWKVAIKISFHHSHGTLWNVLVFPEPPVQIPRSFVSFYHCIFMRFTVFLPCVEWFSNSTPLCYSGLDLLLFLLLCSKDWNYIHWPNEQNLQVSDLLQTRSQSIPSPLAFRPLGPSLCPKAAEYLSVH